jgi:hypothetical protein
LPNNKKKVFLPIAAAAGLVLLLWLAFHDRSPSPASGRTSVSAPVKSALAKSTPWRSVAARGTPAGSACA